MTGHRAELLVEHGRYPPAICFTHGSVYMTTLSLFAFIIQIFWVPDLILCFSLWQIAFSKSGYHRSIAPIPPALFTCEWCPSLGVPFPHIWVGACDYSNPESEADVRLWNIWGYHRRDVATTWFSWLRPLTLDPWRLCWGDRVERSRNSRNPCLRSPSFSSWEDALR